MKNDCLFCAIAGGEIPSNKVYVIHTFMAGKAAALYAICL